MRANAANGVFLNRCHGCALNGNAAALNGHSGIRLTGTTSSTCTSNTIYDNGRSGQALTDFARRDGITLYGPCHSNVVAHNRCFDDGEPKTQRHGLAVLSSSGTGNLIGPNLLDGNADVGLYTEFTSLVAHTVPFRKSS